LCIQLNAEFSQFASFGVGPDIVKVFRQPAHKSDAFNRRETCREKIRLGLSLLANALEDTIEVPLPILSFGVDEA
jgi:hypothetical protein